MEMSSVVLRHSFQFAFVISCIYARLWLNIFFLEIYSKCIIFLVILIQLKEMDGVTVSQQSAEKKKGFPDWINLMKPGNEEKDHWVSLTLLIASIELTKDGLILVLELY